MWICFSAGKKLYGVAWSLLVFARAHTIVAWSLDVIELGRVLSACQFLCLYNDRGVETAAFVTDIS
jgi:hypothetical protein